MSRAAFKPTPNLRARVKALAAVGVPQDDIATIIGCSAKTLRKHLRHELDTGTAEATAMIARTLFELVNAGNVGAQIFWAKTRGRDRTSAVGEESPATNDDQAPSSRRSIVIMPDNRREPETTEWAIGVWNEAEALVKEKAERKEREAQRYRFRRAKSMSKAAGAPAPSEE